MADIAVGRPVYQFSRLTADDQLGVIDDMVRRGALGYGGRGEIIEAYERRCAALTGRRDAVAVSSATTGFELICRTLGLGAGDEVLVPEVGWISVAATVRAVGATPRVAPVHEHLAVEWPDVRDRLGPATKAVVVTHIRGRVTADVVRIARELADRDVVLVEDCSQAWGAAGPDGPAGSHGLAAFFSTQTLKVVATGEGGVVVADDPDLVRSVRHTAGYLDSTGPDLGWLFNRRLSEVAAAQALPQVARLPELVAMLRRLQAEMADVLTDVPDARVIVDGAGGSNGSAVGLWLPTVRASRAVAERLRQAGFNVWQMVDHDLHSASAWPTGMTGGLGDLRCYLDVAVPWVDDVGRGPFLDRLREVCGAVRP